MPSEAGALSPHGVNKEQPLFTLIPKSEFENPCNQRMPSRSKHERFSRPPYPLGEHSKPRSPFDWTSDERCLECLTDFSRLIPGCWLMFCKSMLGFSANENPALG